MKNQLGFGVGVENNQYNWDYALTESVENPYPLAPPDLVENGLVTPMSYQQENNWLGQFVFECMLGEKLSGLIIKVFGAGLLRDLWWLLLSVDERNCSVEILDSSRKVACVNAVRFLRKYNLHRKVKIRSVDVLAWLPELGIGETVYAGQFLQNQGPGTLEEMMNLLGTLQTTVYMLHPRGEDNPYHLVRWNNTTPYEDKEWREPYEKGLGKNAEVSVLGVHRYFDHQSYTLFRIKPTA